MTPHNDRPSSRDGSSDSGATSSHLLGAYPQILTTDFAAARAFYRDQLEFETLYEYGEPPFYALVVRGQARLNLRFVHQHPIDQEIVAAENVLAANLPVVGVQDLYRELDERGVRILQPLTRQPWGTEDFLVADPDGNRLCFAEAV